MPVFSPDDPEPAYCQRDPFDVWWEAEELESIEAAEYDRRAEWEAAFLAAHPEATEAEIETVWEIAEGRAPREVAVIVGEGSKAPRLDPEGGAEDDSHALAVAFPSGEGGGDDGRDFFVEQGPTGNPAGRPRRGSNKPTQALALIQERTEASLDELKASLGRGRPAGRRKEVRDSLARAVVEIRRDSLATLGALAAALDCSERTIERLAA